MCIYFYYNTLIRCQDLQKGEQKRLQYLTESEILQYLNAETDEDELLSPPYKLTTDGTKRHDKSENLGLLK